MSEIYDPKDVTVNIDGTIITGFAEGTFVKCEKNEDNFAPYVGAQGEVDYAKSADKTGKITVTIKSTSPSLNYLNNLANKSSTVSAYVIDANSGLKYGGTECVCMKPADAEFSNEITEREFTIHVSDYTVE